MVQLPNSPQLSIVVPTYAERANIRPLVAALTRALADGPQWELVIVDDSSPDGTGDEVRALIADGAPLRLVQRVGRRGLAGAVIEGILSASAPVCAVMDADLQHDERALVGMWAQMQADSQLDLVIGTRADMAEGLPPARARGSRWAGALARRGLGLGVADPLSGFFMLRRDRFVPLAPKLQRAGFKVLADLLSVAQGRWRVAAQPYRFRPRQRGGSKLDLAVVAEFLALIISRRSRGLLPIRAVMFGAVGLSGVAVQLLGVWGARAVLPGGFGVAQAAGVALAMTSNFLLNNALTYRDVALRGRAMLRGLLSFYAVCAVGAVANVSLASALSGLGAPWVWASLAGAAVGAVWNFVLSALATWRTGSAGG